MARSRKTAKDAGTRFETLTAAHIARHTGLDVERRRLAGIADRGDLSGLRVPGGRLVVECKDYGGRFEVGPWLNEAERERVNDGALAGFVIAKRRGTTNPGEQVVMMTLNDLLAILTNVRPEEDQ